MSRGFKIVAEGDYALFTRPEMKLERVSYDVPPPGALEGMLKSVYWKPAIKYVIDRIIVFHPIEFVNIRRNEVKEKVSYQAVKSQMNHKGGDPSVITSEDRTQRAAMLLRDVKYGIEFHFELTGNRSEKDDESEKKHYNIIRRRLEKGQHFRTPCFGCAEFPVKKLTLVGEFDLSEIDDAILAMGDCDLGFMSYRVAFEDNGQPINGDWEHPEFSDRATTEYYRPHMIGGVIDVAKYREGLKC